MIETSQPPPRTQSVEDELDWVGQLLADFASPVPAGTDPSTHLSAVLRELARRTELAEQVRDQWIARTVRAEDAVKQQDQALTWLHLELDETRNIIARQGDELAAFRSGVGAVGYQSRIDELTRQLTEAQALLRTAHQTPQPPTTAPTWPTRLRNRFSISPKGRS